MHIVVAQSNSHISDFLTFQEKEKTNIDKTRIVLYLVAYKFTAIAILILQMRIHIISRLNHLNYNILIHFSLNLRHLNA